MVSWRRSAIAALGVLVAGGCAGRTASAPFAEGISLYRQARYAEAVAAFDEAVRATPDSPEALSNRASARLRLGDVGGAIQDYGRALEGAPRDHVLYTNRGNAYVLAGYPLAAIADFTRALELAPSSPRAAFNRGVAQARLGRLDRARADWRYAADVAPNVGMREWIERTLALYEPKAVARNGEPVMAGRPVAAISTGQLGGVTVVPGVGRPSPAASGSGGATPSASAPPVGGVSLVPGSSSPPPGPPALPPPIVRAPERSPLAPGAPVVLEPPAPASPRPVPALDSRSLATRAVVRAMDGDRAGALVDMRAAIALETNAERRAMLERLLRSLEAPAGR